MRLRRRSPLVDLVERQLALFAADHGQLLADIDAALTAYDSAEGDDAEERYGGYVDLVDAAREELEDIRDTYGRTLPEETEAEYRDLFARVARKQFPRIAAELE
jgi:hypothetical protein